MSDSVQPHRQQPTRLPLPWDSPGQNTGVGCHFLLQCMRVKSESEVARSCPTLSDPVDCSPPGSSVHGLPRREHWSGRHRLLQCMRVKRESEVARSCPTLSDPVDRSPPGSSVHGLPRRECWSGHRCLLRSRMGRHAEAAPHFAHSALGPFRCFIRYKKSGERL